MSIQDLLTSTAPNPNNVMDNPLDNPNPAPDDVDMDSWLGDQSESYGEEDLPSDDEPLDDDFYRNLVDDLDDDCLEKIASDTISNYQADLNSRKGWEETIEMGLNLLGLKIEVLNEPYPGACSAHHPLIIESAVKFQSKASAELLPSKGPVQTTILGKSTPEKLKRAERIKQFMNYQLTKVMPEYYEDTERMLFWLPIIGSCFKKMYYSTALRRAVSEFVYPDQFVVPFSTNSLESAQRYTHIIYKTPNDLKRAMVSGFYKELDFETELTGPTVPEYSEIRRKMDEIRGIESTGIEGGGMYTLLEQHVELDLPGDLGDKDGIALPYIVTLEKGSNKILAIRRNWKPTDETKQKRMWFTHYTFVPGLGFHGVGFIHLLGNLEMTLTTVLRSLVDSGQFANMQGGFKLRGTRIVGDNQPIAPGEFKEVESTIQDLSKSFYALPFKEPSSVLYNMLQFMEGRGQKFADSTEQVINDSAGYGPVGTTMALLDAATKFFTAIHKRSHFSQRKELQILFDINSETLDDEVSYDIPDDEITVYAADFDGSIEVMPVSDPNISSKAQRMTVAQTVLQMASQFPAVHDTKEALRNVYRTMEVDNYEDFIKPDEVAVESDPLTDINNASLGKPIKAFAGQNHDAHIQIKASFVQDPSNGSNPFMGPIIPVLQANIREHIIMKYEEQMGGIVQQATNGQPEESVNPQVLEQIMAEAAQQIMQFNIEQANKQQTSDPEMMVAQAEMIKAQAQSQRVENERLDKMTQNALDAERNQIDKLNIVSRSQDAKVKAAADVQKAQMSTGSKMVFEALKNQKDITMNSKMLASQERQANARKQQQTSRK